MRYVYGRLNIFQKMYDHNMIPGNFLRSYMTFFDYRMSCLTLYDYGDICMADNTGCNTKLLFATCLKNCTI